ncbi:hypothetical protein [Aquibacillus salsiterrae]|uniref:SPOR domain-containing protein n=1 Tax=Aquibacillus salsiterrae TaxID=2950439 RepID=A0A9X4AEY5_9BACI|nr:hypothetical protein [Aquibacillus salsiterrae]MDC3415675.1 hypothetical protein [Aquibacillus salsiterrae]
MDNYKTISVKLNGKEAALTGEQKERESWNSSFEEQAASTERLYDPEDLLEFEKNEDSGDLDAWLESDVTYKRPKKIPPVFKVFGLAALSATVIGVSLGFIMLKMLAGIDDSGVQAAQTSNQVSSPTVEQLDTNASENSTSKINTVSTELQPMEAFIIQGGLVSTKEKASQIQDGFAQGGFPTMVWQDDSGFRIFVGIANQKADVEKAASSIKNANIEGMEDPYVRSWQTDSSTIELTKVESEWLTAFPDNWNKSLQAIGNTEQLTDAGLLWEEWLDMIPETNNERLVKIQQEATNLVEGIKSAEDPKQLQIYLLQLWELYTSLSKE